MYLMCLMVAYKLGGEINQELKEELEKAKIDEEERAKYGMLGKLSYIKEILGIVDNLEEKEEEKTKDKRKYGKKFMDKK